MLDRKTFWMVYARMGAHPLRHEHPYRDMAEKEAERLAEAHAGIEFYVLEARSVSINKTVVTMPCEDEPTDFGSPF